MALGYYPSRSGVILRVEDKNGAGPYWDVFDKFNVHQGTGCTFDPIQHPDWDMDHGLPSWLIITPPAEQWLFGFNTIEQYLAWFHTPKARATLNSNGYRLTLYKSPRVFYSPRQCIAIIPNHPASVLGSYPCTFTETHPSVEEKIRDIQYAAEN